MKTLIYATSNSDKHRSAAVALLPYGIQVEHQFFEVPEFQTYDGEAIARDKAEQAFAKFQVPVLVNDDTWEIPALDGFPSTGMKLCNHFLKANDWVRLLAGVTDRRVFLISWFAFQDGSDLRVLRRKSEFFLLEKPRGQHEVAPFLELVAQVGSNQSMAEDIAAGKVTHSADDGFWRQLAEVIGGG